MSGFKPARYALRIGSLGGLAWMTVFGVTTLADEPKLKIEQTPPSLWIRAAERPVLEYRFEKVSHKPYVKKWFTPGGVNILRDAPQDHLHHHGMMYAIGVNGVNFWEETNEPGKEVHRGFENVGTTTSGGIAVAGFTERLDWVSDQGKPLLAEKRTLHSLSGKDLDASVLIWKSRFTTPPAEAVELTGRHYFGLGMRFVESMDRVGRFFNADDKQEKTVRGSERLVPARWIAYTAPAGGKQVTVALFDHPANPRFPAGKFTMTDPFAYLSATLDLKKKPLPLAADASLDLRYAVALWERDVSADEVEKLYRRWVLLLSD